MKIIETNALPNGAHRNQNSSSSVVPEGWAVVPDSMTIPSTFPFVNIEVEDGVVTSMTAGIVPEQPSVDPGLPTMEDRVTAVEETTAELSEALELLLSGDTGEEVAANGDEA